MGDNCLACQWSKYAPETTYVNPYAHTCLIDKMSDPVNPPHYKQSSIEVIDFMREVSSTPDFVAYCRLTALKYIARAGKKEDQPPAQDYAKAAWYAQMAAHTLNPDKYKDPRK